MIALTCFSPKPYFLKISSKETLSLNAIRIKSSGGLKSGHLLISRFKKFAISFCITALRTIFYRVPNLSPFLSPGKWPPTDRTCLFFCIFLVHISTKHRKSFFSKALGRFYLHSLSIAPTITLLKSPAFDY